MTYDQHIASDPVISAWVSASAGTGKTKVLTDRVLRLLLAGAPPDKILCITYTHAASAEMEARIGSELGRWVALPDEELAASLASLMGKPPGEKTLARARKLFAIVLDSPARIRIQTIHSFCQAILARFPLEAEVPPHFTPLDEITSRELQAQARAMLFIDAGRPDKPALAEAVSEVAASVGEGAFRELITQIVRQRRTFTEWLAEPADLSRISAALGIAPEMDEAGLAQRYLRYTHDEEIALKQACDVLMQSEAKSDRQMLAALTLWLREREDAEGYSHAFITDKGTPRKTLCTRECARIWPPLTPVLAEEQQRMLAWSEAHKSLRIAKLSGYVATIAAAMLEHYQALKQRHSALDYDDLILFTSRLLRRPGVSPWVLYKLDGGIDHLLIDEAQDTAPEQWQIADALAEEFFAGEGARSVKRTLFVVGDEKQSIYSFQGADPLEFDRMQRKLSKLATDGAAEFKRVRLDLSFRSTVPVLQAVDSIFAQGPARDGLVFTESDIRHVAHRIGMKGRVELWPLTEVEAEEALPIWHIPDKPVFTQRPDIRTAEHIAQTIDEWLKEGRPLASQARAVRPGDIMILVQRRGAFADALLRALKRKGVPVAGADRLLLTEHIVVMDCMALARFLLLPQDDLSLAEVLRSPFVGLSEEALFELAYGRGTLTLWQRLKDNPSFAEVYAYLSDLLAKTDYMPPFELFAYGLETTGGRKKLAGRLGEEITDPLNEFLALALQYSKTHPPSLQGFLHWLETGEIEIKRDMEKGRDEVRILTVHGAKGLQAPILFLPDTTRTPLYEGGILWTGAEPNIPLWSPAKDSDGRNYRSLRDARRVQAEQEYRRLLYVALTRAEDELYICGWKGSKAVPEGCWYELMRRAAEGWEAEGDKRIISCEQLQKVTARPGPVAVPFSGALPAWVNAPVASEPVPARPLAPSRLKDTQDTLSPLDNAIYERGLLVHRLLQYLPDATVSERGEVMQRFFRQYATGLSPEQKDEIAKEVLAILDHPEFAPVFGPGSVAEASIAGIAKQGSPVVVAGRIDRLLVQPHAVYIIDYKTGRRVPKDASAIPEGYLRQMEAYRQLVREIYPDKTVHCALLWTSGPVLMPVSDALLQRLAA